MAADIPNLAATYIQNTTSPQTANFNISGNGIVGGSVGIGTSNPSSKMHVFGNGGLRITADSDLNAGFGLRLNNAPKWSVATVSPGQFQIFNDAIGQNAVWIDPANNNVGIGTGAPSERLEVVGNIKATGTFSGDGSGLTNVSAPRTTTLALLGSLRWDLLGQKTVSVGSNPIGMAFDGSNVWVANHGTSNVTKLRATDGANLGTFPAGSQPEFVAFDGANIWVTNIGSTNNLTKLRASDGANLGTFTVDPFIKGLAFDGTNIWVTSSCNCGTKVTKVRPSDGGVLGFINLSFGPNGIAFDGANIWITHQNENKVTKIRTSDGADLGTFTVGGNAPTGVAFDGGSIWVANSTTLPGGNSVTRLRASDGANLGNIAVGASPNGIAFDGTNIWVSNTLGNSVTRLRALDGINLGTFPVGSAPYGVVFDGANIWVANQSSGTVTKLSAFP